MFAGDLLVLLWYYKFADLSPPWDRTFNRDALAKLKAAKLVERRGEHKFQVTSKGVDLIMKLREAAS